MRTKLLLAGIIAILAIAANWMMVTHTKKALATNSHHDRKQQYVIRTSGRSFVDLPPTGPSAGDRVVFDNPLYDRTNTKELGSSRVECVQVGASPAMYHCLAVFTLPGGQITMQGIADFTQTPATVAITGATGAYQQVQGQAIFSETSPTTDSVTIELR